MKDRLFFRSEGEDGGVSVADDPVNEAPVVTAPPVMAPELSPDQVSEWLTKNGYVGVPNNDPRLNPAPVQQPKDDDEGDDDDLVSRRDVKKLRDSFKAAQDETLSAAEKRMSDRYVALDAATAKIATYGDLPADKRAEILAQVQYLPTDQLKSMLQTGVVDKLIKAELFDLVQQGKVTPRTAPAPSGAAPTGGSPANPGLRGRLNAEQRAVLEQNEANYGFKYTDEHIKESFGL